MKKLLITSFSLFLFIILIACTHTAPKTFTSKGFQPVAVIELFTSQGCSSCPPADKLLAKTITDAKATGKNIFALSFHVDYWNRLGWTDPFSEQAFSQRQHEYATHINAASVYTPQMVVNGTKEFVGSSEGSLALALASVLKDSSIVSFDELSVTVQDGKPLQVKYTLKGNYSSNNINVALVSLKETTQIKRGENGGLTLTNENIVRQFITQKAMAEAEINFGKSSISTEGNFAVIAYTQNKSTLKITGAAMAMLK